VAISSFVSGGGFLSGRRLGGGENGSFGGKSGLTGLGASVGGVSLWEGGEAWRGLAVGESLGRRQGLEGGA